MAAVRRHVFMRLLVGRQGVSDQHVWRSTPTTNIRKSPELQTLISGSGLPLPNLKAKLKRIEGAGSFPGRLGAAPLVF